MVLTGKFLQLLFVLPATIHLQFASLITQPRPGKILHTMSSTINFLHAPW